MQKILLFVFLITVLIAVSAANPVLNLTSPDKKTRNVDQSWQRIWGKSKTVRNHYNEVNLNLQESENLKRKLNLIFRAYNDGIAIRYNIPEQQNINQFELTSERIWFNLNNNDTMWAANYNGYIYFLPTVTPGQSSVRKGEAGKPSLLYKFTSSGLSAQPYRSATGFSTASLKIQTSSPSI